MPLFEGRGLETTVGVALLVVLALAFAAMGYVERSSDAAFAKFMSATELGPSDPGHSNAKGQTGCPVGKKKLPTQLTPLP
jgi:hypothetical protein